MRSLWSLGAVALLQLICLAHFAVAHHHEHEGGHHGPTYEVTAARNLGPDAKRLALTIVDEATGDFTAARLSLTLDGRPFVPNAVSRHGLRFVSIHEGKKQRATIIYARGSGRVEIAIPDSARRGTVVVTKGYEFGARRAPFEVARQETALTVRLKRWSTVRNDGWMPADEHLHYERSDPRHNADWLDMMAADGLTHAYFMVLKGGNLPGVWAKQYAYGEDDRATDGRRLIVPGEEVRDSRQGHINLLGMGKLIEPISTGGIGKPPHAFNYPALHDVFVEAKRSGGIGGPAHGGALARNSTAVVDTVLGAAEFFEIANTHLYKSDVWYRLMNCGFILPPAAGTDLPNFPFRDDWQPLLGETRMYVRVGQDRDFRAWRDALRRGEVFVSSGPIVRLTVNGIGPGGTVRLPKRGGEVRIVAELASTENLAAFEIICNGRSLELEVNRQTDEDIHRWRIERPIEVSESCWLAAAGRGSLKQSLARHTGIKQPTMSHTAAIKVIVGDDPITSRQDAGALLDELAKHKEAYRTDGKFERAEDRNRVLELFDQAMRKLESQASP